MEAGGDSSGGPQAARNSQRHSSRSGPEQSGQVGWRSAAVSSTSTEQSAQPHQTAVSDTGSVTSTAPRVNHNSVILRAGGPRRVAAKIVDADHDFSTIETRDR
jgi:hypothetical protein